MGLFNLFKAKANTIPHSVQYLSNRPECDISKTYLVVELLKIPRAKRDANWHQVFYQHVATASFACGQPQLLTGPDGFPYFILRTPTPDQPFESFCIQNMKDDFLLGNGWGVVFNPAEDKTADWVFTHGNIVNLHLNERFVSVIDAADTKNIAFTRNVGFTTKAEQVMTGQPSENYLPRTTRAVLKTFLQSKGIKDPMVMMLSSHGEGKIIRKLAFNIHPEDYPVTSQLDHLMQQVGWFLPNDYILIPLSKKSNLARGLNEL